MVTLNFGTLCFNNEDEYYIALGSFCNKNAFSISYEPNKQTGSYADAYRMRKLSGAQNLIQPIESAIRSGNRINCNDYVKELIKKHNFIQSGKTIYGILENVIQTVPEAFVAKFVESYTKSAATNETSIVIYETENIRTTALSLKKTCIPKAPASPVLAKSSTTKNKTKHDYIKEHIRNTDIGERGEKLVFDLERKKLKKAVEDGIITSMENLLKWVSLEDDSVGYDILSYDIDKKVPIYIEVKTTTGSKFTPFFMSENEVAFSQNNSAHYRLYRVFNFKNAVAEYFELSGDISNSANVQVDAVNFKVTIK